MPPWLLELLEKYGVSTFWSVVFFLVFTGAIPSPITENRLLIQSTLAALTAHIQATNEASSKLINLSLSQCVNAALINKDQEAARLCLKSMDMSEYTQRRIANMTIEREVHKQ